MIDRRSMLVGAGALLGSASLMRAHAEEASLFPVVETADGKVRGIVSGCVSRTCRVQSYYFRYNFALAHMQPGAPRAGERVR